MFLTVIDSRKEQSRLTLRLESLAFFFEKNYLETRFSFIFIHIAENTFLFLRLTVYFSFDLLETLK